MPYAGDLRALRSSHAVTLFIKPYTLPYVPATTTVVGLGARAARSGHLLLLEQQELSEVDGAVAVEVRDVEELLHALLVMVGVGVRVGVMVRVRDRVAGGVSKGDG